MGNCFFILLFAFAGIFVMLTMIRWFEQTADAVDHREWNKLTLLTLFPFASWLFASRVSAGRPTMVPHHEPVRGFGKLPKGGIAEVAPSSAPAHQPAAQEERASEPPPGTPKEFLGIPTVPPKKARAPLDPEKIAKLRAKMKEQGMIDDDDD